MHGGKAASPTGNVIEQIWAAGKNGIAFIRELTNSVLVDNVFPEDWAKSIILNMYKVTGDDLDRNSYRGLKLIQKVSLLTCIRINGNVHLTLRIR